MFKRLLHEPLAHFLILGAALFLLFSAVAKPGAPQDGKIVVTSGKIEQLAAGFVRIWQRAPSAEELDGLIEDYVKEEVLYREALAMGLDKDDSVIRRRLRQKIEFLTEDAAAAVLPTEKELQAWLASHPDKFRLEPKLALRQVYISVSRHAAAATSEAGRLLGRLNSAGKELDASGLGDATMLPHELPLSSVEEIARVFGDGFAQQVAPMEPGRWHGPVKSGYGLHLVHVSERAEGKLRPLADVRDAVQREWLEARRKEIADTSYLASRAKYSITIEPPPREHADGAARTNSTSSMAGER